MAEIKIEKKKPIWPWILILLIIAALIYFVFFTNHETTSVNSVESENSTSENTGIQNKKAGLNESFMASYEDFANINQKQSA